MQLNIDQINKTINNIIDKECVKVEPIIRLVSDESALTIKVDYKTNAIPFGEALIYAQLPYIMFPYKHNVLKRIIFYHYFAYDNVKNFRLGSGFYCIRKLNDLIITRQKRLYHCAKNLYLNEILYFFLFHECFHALFHSSEKYAEEKIGTVKSSFIELMDGVEDASMPFYTKKALSAFMTDTILDEDNFYEEIACDWYAIKTIFESSFFFKSDVSAVEKQLCARQIINSIIMQEYSHCMSSLQTFTFSRASFRHYNKSHFKSYLRTISAISALSDCFDNPSYEVKKSMTMSHSLLKGHNLFNIIDTASAVDVNEDPDIDLEKQDSLMKLYLKVNNLLGKWMLGEDIQEDSIMETHT